MYVLEYDIYIPWAVPVACMVLAAAAGRVGHIYAY
jgi:hypothetical protein